MKTYTALASAVHKVSSSITWIAAGALFLMIVMTFFDVAGRYFLNLPIIGVQDLTTQFMVFIIYGALAYVSLERTHIIVDVLPNRLSKRNRAILGIVANFLALLVVIPIVWRLSVEAGNTVIHLNITTATIGVPIAPFYLFAAFGALFLGFEMVFDLVRYVGEAKAGSGTEGIEEPPAT